MTDRKDTGDYPVTMVPEGAKCRWSGPANTMCKSEKRGKEAFKRLQSDISSQVYWVCVECGAWHFPKEILEDYGDVQKG